MESDDGYPVFKGLQKPLEFMGIRGRFLMLAAVVAGVAFLTLIIVNICVNQLAGFIAGVIVLIVGIVALRIKQKQGLHDKKRYSGVVVYRKLIK